MTKKIYTNTNIASFKLFFCVEKNNRVGITSYHVKDKTFPHFPLKVNFLYLHQDQRMLFYKSNAFSYSLQNVLLSSECASECIDFSSLLAFGKLSPSPFQEALRRTELGKIFDLS